MTDLSAKLAVLGSGDPERQRSLLSDLVDLLNRRASDGEGSGYHFSDPAIAALPVRLTEDEARVIAEAVAGTLLDRTRAEDVRATAAFVLGKTHHIVGLNAIVRAVTSPAGLPAGVARQAAFAYEVLSETCGPPRAATPEEIGEGFRRLGIPWDEATHRVLVDES